MKSELIIQTGATGSANSIEIAGNSEMVVRVKDATFTTNGTTILSNSEQLSIDTNASYGAKGTVPVGAGAQVTLTRAATFTADDDVTLSGSLIVGQSGSDALFIVNGDKSSAQGTLQGTASADTAAIAGELVAFGQTVNLMGGNDDVTVSGTFDEVTLNLGAGNDSLTIETSGTLSYTGQADGGDDTDSLIFTGTVDHINRAANDFTNFETLVKNGTNTWTLSTSGGAAAFETLLVNSGARILVGEWSFAENTTTVVSGATLETGDGDSDSSLTEMGALNVFGTLNVLGTGSVTARGSTTVHDGGAIGVVTGGSFVIDGGTTTIAAGGTLTVEAGASFGGSDKADTLIVAGTLSGDDMTVDLKGGDDTLVLTAGLLLDTDGLVTLEGGGRTTGDTLIFNGTDSDAINMGQLVGFEILKKQDSGFWTLTTDTATIQSLSVEGGGLTLVGNWNVTGNTTTIAENTELIIGDGGTKAYRMKQAIWTSAGSVDTDGATKLASDADVRARGQMNAGGPVTIEGNGRVGVFAGGLFSAGDTTTLSDMAELRILDGGQYTAGLPITLNGGTLRGRGLVVGSVKQ